MCWSFVPADVWDPTREVSASGCLGFHKEYLILVQPTWMATRLLGVFALQGAGLMIREIKIYRWSWSCASEIYT